VVYILPPYCITTDEVHRIYDIIQDSLTMEAL
jgi:adenosylmethionine-8-amino-7-oxononanoate aminotransferase